jgi:hypothetical protein
MRLQKAASGLLSFFELKVDGGNPPNFGEAVTPTVDVMPFYAAANQIAGTATGNVTVQGDTLISNIPQGSAWRVRGVGFTILLAAATAGLDGAGGSIYYDPGSGGIILHSGLSGPKVTAANAWMFSSGVILPNPFIALPGGRIIFQNDRLYSVASSAVMRIFYDQIQYP